MISAWILFILTAIGVVVLIGKSFKGTSKPEDV